MSLDAWTLSARALPAGYGIDVGPEAPWMVFNYGLSGRPS